MTWPPPPSDRPEDYLRRTARPAGRRTRSPAVRVPAATAADLRPSPTRPSHRAPTQPACRSPSRPVGTPTARRPPPSTAALPTAATVVSPPPDSHRRGHPAARRTPGRRGVPGRCGTAYPAGAAPARRTNTMAIVSLILSLVGLALRHHGAGRRRARPHGQPADPQTGEEGDGLATGRHHRRLRSSPGCCLLRLLRLARHHRSRRSTATAAGLSAASRRPAQRNGDLADAVAAVDHEHLTGDVGRGRRAQERDRGGDLVRGAGAAHRRVEALLELGHAWSGGVDDARARPR